jgi:hypothetical protein
MSEGEKAYVVDLTVQVLDRIAVCAKTVEEAKKRAKMEFIKNMSDYQAVNSVFEKVEVI